MESVFVSEKQVQARAFSLLLAQRVREFFRDAQNRSEFERWYEEQYGRRYEWKKREG